MKCLVMLNQKSLRKIPFAASFGCIGRTTALSRVHRYQTYKKTKRSTVERGREHREYRRTFWRVSNGKAIEKEHYFHISYHGEWERIPPKRAEQDRELACKLPLHENLDTHYFRNSTCHAKRRHSRALPFCRSADRYAPRPV